MHRCDIRTAEQALAYITDCNLATVSTMAMTKSRRKAEYQRQQDIAQSAIDWMDLFGVDYSKTRAAAVKDAGSVSLWAKSHEV